MEKPENTPKRVFTGNVVSDKMDKTIVVETTRTFKHPLIKKVMRRIKKYKVHDPEGVAQVGDVVEFYEGRPVSKTKFMYLFRVVKQG
jgi:small subunit ribosomal protein S17